MLDIIKKKLRITHDLLDEDIQQNIDACLLDLERVGIDSSQESELLTKAVELFCKWQFDYQSKSQQFEKNYCDLRDSLSLCETYAKVGE